MLWRKTGIPLPRAYKLQGYCATGLSNLPSEQFLHIFLFFFPFQVWDLQESVSYIIDFRSRIVNILLALQDVGIPLLYLVKVFVLWKFSSLMRRVYIQRGYNACTTWNDLAFSWQKVWWDISRLDKLVELQDRIEKLELPGYSCVGFVMF